MPITWTDNPVVAGITRIRALHVNELRRAVDNYRFAIGVPPGGWTDNPVTTATPVRAVHFTELKSAIQVLWNFHQQGTLPSWSAGSPPSSARSIRASDVNDLRLWTDLTDPPPPTIGVNIDPGFPVASPSIVRLTTAHFGGVRFTLKNDPIYTSYITNALNAGLNIIAVVGTNDSSWTPVDTRVVLQIYNEPDVVEPLDPTHHKSPVQYAQMWAEWRDNPQYQGYTMYTAGFGTGQGSYYGEFLAALSTNHPNTPLPSAVAIHMYSKDPDEIESFVSTYTVHNETIPAIVTEWNSQSHVDWIEPSQRKPSDPANPGTGVATLWSSWFPWSTAQRPDGSVPGLYNAIGQKNVQCDRLVHDTLNGECT
jgi:hypothetical protein